MRRDYRIGVAVVFGLALAFVLIWGFMAGHRGAAAEGERERAVESAVRVKLNPLGPPTLILTPDLQAQAGIALMPLRAAPYQNQVQAYGSVLELQSFTDLGNTVASAAAQRTTAEAKLAASRAAFERAQALYRNNQNVSEAQLQAAAAAFHSDEASLHAAQVQVQNAIASAYQAWGPVLGKSLADNTALAQDVIRHRKVLVQVSLPLGIPLGEPQRNAWIETAEGRRVRIELISAAIRTQPRFQGASFFYIADVATGLLPGMNVMVRLPDGHPVLGAAIPATAVVWLDGRAWVYLRTADNSFTRREISTAHPQPGGGFVVPANEPTQRVPSSPPPLQADTASRPLPANATLVVTGAQVLLSQEFSAQIDMGD